MSIVSVAPLFSLYALPKADGYSPKTAPKIPAPPSPPKPVIVAPPVPTPAPAPAPKQAPVPAPAPVPQENKCEESDIKSYQIISRGPAFLEEQPDDKSSAAMNEQLGNAPQIPDDFISAFGDDVMQMEIHAASMYRDANGYDIQRVALPSFSSPVFNCGWVAQAESIYCKGTAKQFNNAFKDSSLFYNSRKDHVNALKNGQSGPASLSFYVNKVTWTDKKTCYRLSGVVDIKAK